jgi:murein DD-endopeptidase MepM/ murein hydrolase activator NlpD
MTEEIQLTEILNQQPPFAPVVPYIARQDKLLLLDFTANNTDLTHHVLNDTNKFCRYIEEKLVDAGCKYGIGGYAEHRMVYSRSTHFDSTDNEEPRRLHLGIDIWGPVNTPVMAPLNGSIHSFAYNDHFGDYGATIILTHNIEGYTFYTLYGHLGLKSLKNLREGLFINQGDVFAEFGMLFENGHWPPHLHFQLIIDIQQNKGDYPGVCKYSEKGQYLDNCPDPDCILSMMKYAVGS